MEIYLLDVYRLIIVIPVWGRSSVNNREKWMDTHSIFPDDPERTQELQLPLCQEKYLWELLLQ